MLKPPCNGRGRPHSLQTHNPNSNPLIPKLEALNVICMYNPKRPALRRGFLHLQRRRAYLRDDALGV